MIAFNCLRPRNTGVREYIRQLQDRGANETARRYRNQLDTPVALATSKATETRTGPSSLELQVEQLRNVNGKGLAASRKTAGGHPTYRPQNAEALAVREQMQQEQEIKLGKGEQLSKRKVRCRHLPIQAGSQGQSTYTEARRQLALAEQQIRVQLRVQSVEQEMRSKTGKVLELFC